MGSKLVDLDREPQRNDFVCIFMDLSWWIWTGNLKETFFCVFMDLSWRIWTGNPKDSFFATLLVIDLHLNGLNPVPEVSTVTTYQTFRLPVNNSFHIYKGMPRVWRIGIECEMQQIWGAFYQCEEWACLLCEVWLRMYFSQSVCYWYEICDVLVPIFHVFWEIDTNSSQCEINELWNLRFNNA